MVHIDRGTSTSPATRPSSRNSCDAHETGVPRALLAKTRDIRSAIRQPTGLDAVLYGSSAIFAGLTLAYSTLLTHRVWAEFATYAYAVAAIVSLALTWTLRESSRSTLVRARTVLAIVTLLGATIAPLVAEVLMRRDRGASYTQDETLTTEQAATDLLHGHSPYTHQALPHFTDTRSFPYLPAMALFGAARALNPRAPWTDARVSFTFATAVFVTIALRLYQASVDQQLRFLQLLIVFPTGALSLASGGDDMPVIGLLFLAVVLQRSGRASASTLSACCAALMKATAWPLTIYLIATARREEAQRRSRFTWPVGPACICIILASMLIWDGEHMLEDTILFPLGLVHPTPSPHGYSFGSMIQAIAHMGSQGPTRTLAAVAAALIALGLARRQSKLTIRDAMRDSGWFLAVLILLVPTLRPGLLIYPLNFWAWGFILRGQSFKDLESESHSLRRDAGARK